MKIDDKFITDLVQNREIDLNANLDQKINAVIKSSSVKQKRSIKRFSLYLSPLVLGLIVLFLIVPVFNSNQAGDVINEIKTEFYIKDKNIKIIWIQKKNFKIRRKKL